MRILSMTYLAFSALFVALACSPEDRTFETSSSSSGSSSSSTGSSTSSGMLACSPGETMDCYSGPDGTLGVGVCAAGVQTCLGDGSGFGPCEGEILPSMEVCLTPQDEDCNVSVKDCGAGLWAIGAGDANIQRGTVIKMGTGGSNILVGGYFDGTLDLGPDVLTSLGLSDMFVAKLDTDGKVLWARRFGGTSDDNLTDIAVDPLGNVYVTGAFQGTVDFGNGPLVSAGGTDVFLIKLDSAGATLWSKRYGDNSSQTSMALAVDPVGNVLVAGGFFGTLDMGTGGLVTAGGSDAFLAKVNPMGTTLWAKSYGDAAAQSILGVGADSVGNIRVVGNNTGTIDLGGGPLVTAGGTDMFVAKLDAGGGAHVWSKGIGDVAIQSAFAGAPVDADGSMTLGGRFLGTLDLGSGPVMAGGMGENYFVAKLDTSGKALWVTAVPTETIKQSGAVGADAQGNVLMTSHVDISVEIGGQSVMAGADDLLVMKFDAMTGAPVWGRVIGAPNAQLGRGITADDKGNVLVTGSFEDSIDFGVGNGPLLSKGVSDMFVAKLAP